MTGPDPMMGLDRRSRLLLGFCAAAVAFAAIDTYVVVLALPEMMAAVDIPVDELQRAAPIVSGFLLGYVAMLPLIGRIADLRGQVPVLAASLAVFAVGSLLTAISYDLTTMVIGRFLQGAGGGGLVPATMALVAALYPVERRGLPLGIVSGVQEIGSVLGPLFGALVLSFGTWRTIFAINLAVGVLLVVAVRILWRQPIPHPGVAEAAKRRTDLLGWVAAVVLLAAGFLVFLQPAELKRDLTWGQLFIPYVDGGSRWVTPVGVIAVGAAVILALRCVFARHPLVDVRGWFRSAQEADLVGATLLAVALGGIVLAFASADPEVAVFNPKGGWFLLGAGLAAAAFVVHLVRADAPIIPRAAMAAVPAWGSLLVSFLVGWALIAALVDIPLFARTTTHRDSQLGAALVLLRFLAALPVGAVVGGYLVRRLPAGVITAVGMLLAAGGFFWMAQWDATSLDGFASNVPLIVGGLGFGLALAPVNAAILSTTTHDTHGLASALVVVARMVGMLVGISVLTTWGLHQLHREHERNPDLGLVDLAIVQEQSVFTGAAVAAVLAAALALVLFRRAPTRGLDTAEVLRTGG
ncbi:MFS transporter [Nocardioides bizhenqiangii]|uniref:MFS transporter n=1 Tax=Nocardioides bizhenqiangii TaxID=3095076 RepID=A0ABZ0ZZ35_9ACTN|nr:MULTISPECIES: MFS transporter [unclassified Nocardioides]MDZ5622467.1 MFS transporter [Nocardioides sp. HM23]WQQ28373.1 MFS transporter [Nocardioides sp. HM61]